MRTEVNWAIYIQKDNSATHTVDIKIFDIPAINEPFHAPVFSLTFLDDQQVDTVRALTNGVSYNWPNRIQVEGESKTFECPLQLICAKYELAPEVLKVRLTFGEGNAVLRYGRVSVVALHYNCCLFAPINAVVYLPLIGRLDYVLRWVRTRALRQNANAGVYRIYQGEGGLCQNWEGFEAGRQPEIKYRSQTDRSGFPRIGFAYELAGRSMIPLLIAFFMGLFSFFIAIIANRLSDTKWIGKTFEKIFQILGIE